MLPDVKKEKRIDITEKKPNVNAYYLVLSGRFKTAKYITLCILVVFLLTMVILFREEITVENFRYLIKDFELGDNTSISSDSLISYDSDLQVNLALYKGDLVVCGSSYFYLCDLRGNKILSETSKFSNPVILSSEKYFMVYGLSEYTYSVYNTFSELHTETFEYPITSAAISDEGMYAICTRTSEYRSVVYLYNKNFEKIGEIYKNEFIMDIQLKKDATELLILYVSSEDGNYCTDIVNCAPYSNQSSSAKKVKNSFPIKCGYTLYGGYSVVYDNKVEFYDSEYILRNTYDFPSSMVPLTVEITDRYTVVTYNKNIVGDDSCVWVMGADGTEILNHSIEAQPKKTKTSENFVFVLIDGSVRRINLSDGAATECRVSDRALDILIVDDDNVLVCYPNRTENIKFGE